MIETCLRFLLLNLMVAAPLFLPAQDNRAQHSPSSRNENSGSVSISKSGDRIAGQLWPVTQLDCVSLPADRYVQLTLEVSGGQSAIAIYAPDGRQLREFNSGQSGPTRISLVTLSDGVYRIEMRPSEALSAATYSLQLDAVRATTPMDTHQVAAESLFFEGETLREEWTAESLAGAMAKYEQALSLWQAMGNAIEEARTRERLGIVFFHQNNPTKALEHFRTGLSRLKSGDRGRSRLLNGVGYVFLSFGDNEKARIHFLQALSASQSESDRQSQAKALNNLGETYYALRNLNKSLEYYAQALALAQTDGYRAEQALALLNAGYTYSDLSEADKALDNYTRALTLWRVVGNRWGEAHTLTALGNLQSKLGEKQEAIVFYGQAMALFKTMGDKVGEAFVLNGRGYTYQELGQTQIALDDHIQALALFRSVNYREGEAGALMRLGEGYYSLKDSTKSLEHLQQALALYRLLNFRLYESWVLRDVGMVYESMGKPIEALRYYRDALQRNRAAPDRRWQAYVHNNIGQIYDALGEKQRALEHFQRAIPLNLSTGDRFGQATTLYNIARVERSLQRLDQSRTTIEAALRITESLRTKVASHDSRASYFASTRQHYELYVDTLMQLHRSRPNSDLDAQAFGAAERARARSLLDSLKESSANIREGVDASLLEQERKLNQALNAKAEQRVHLTASNTEAQTLAKEIERITVELDEVRALIRSSNPRYAALTQPQPLTLKQIQQQVLDDDSVLIEYLLGEEHSYVWAITRTEISSAELPSRAKIEAVILRFREVLTVNQPVPNESLQQYEARIREAQAQFPAAAAELSDLLITPVQNKLGKKRLIIVPDGALHSIPFQPLTVPTAGGGAAPKDRIPLLANHEIVYEPSASTLALVLSETRPPAENTVAVFANPVFEADDARVKIRTSGGSTTISEQQGVVRGVFRDLGLSDGQRVPPLPASREEAEAIMSFVPRGTGLKAMGFDANRHTASQPELAHYRIVHFATHGFVDYEHPELSGLVLSLVDQHGQPQPGHLRLHDIYNLKLSANLVVLSACNTGLGKQIKGEGLIGLTRGFMYAGADSVVASLWKVDDDATAALMARFYEGMFVKGLTPAAALREAQLWMSQQERWRAPYFWAAFTIQGRYDQVQNVGFSSARAQTLVASAGVVSMFLMACMAFGRRRSRAL